MKYFFIYLIVLFFVSCMDNKEEVIIYTSVDQVFSSQIIKDFEQKTNIKVKVLYDTEATKAISLEKRIIAEKKHPKADVFWNSEFMRTQRLTKLNLLDNYNDNNLTYKPKYNYLNQKYWSGIGLRSRVFIVNKNLMEEKDYPKKLNDLLDSKYKGKIAISLPYSGSTSTHFAALYKTMGKNKFIKFIKGLKKNKVALLGGNSVVKDAVGRGNYLFGLVDSDDALVGINAGLPIEMIFYNQDNNGTFSIYNTISIIKNSPNPKNGKVFLKYLLSKEIEQKMIKLNSVQYSVLNHEKPKFISWSLEPSKVINSLNDSVEVMKNVFK